MWYNFLYEIMEAIAMIRGTCGKNLTWTLDDNGMLIISGIGDMTTSIGIMTVDDHSSINF